MAFIAWLLLFAGLLAADAIAAPVAVPPLSAHVVDKAGALDDAQVRALESELDGIERGKGAQVAVLVVPTTGDETIEQYAIRVADAWKLGRKGVDDGVLVLVAMDDHRLRIEVGRGLEGAIPDAIANRIIDGYVEPQFKRHDYAGGLRAAVDRLGGVIDGQPLPWPPPEAEASGAAASGVGEPAATALPVPAYNGHVIDLTQFFFSKQDSTALEAKLNTLETAKGIRLAILVVDTTGDETAAQYSDRILEAWGRGRADAGKDALILMATGDAYGRAIRFGPDLKAKIPDATAERVYTEQMQPLFIRGDFVGGLKTGIDSIARLADGEPMPPAPKPEGDFSASLIDAIMPPPFGNWLVLLVGLPFLFLVVSGLLSWKAALLRGCVTTVAVCIFLLLIGSGWLFALLLGAIAFYPAMLNQSDGPEPDWTPDTRSRSNVSLGSIAWSVLGMVGSSVISGGGGRGGFSGGGGGFSGGGASGSW